MIEGRDGMYLPVFTLNNLALLSAWLAETGELYVDVDLPHSGGSSFSFFVQSIADLRALIAQQDWPEIRITIFRNKQYPLRGQVDNELIEHILEQIPDGQSYTILSAEEGHPQPVTYYDSGNRHEVLRHKLEELQGRWVAVGLDPFEQYLPARPASKHEEVFAVSVSKNQNYYERYAKDPGRYEWLNNIWNQQE